MKRGTISKLSGNIMSGLWQLQFENGDSCHIESRNGIRQLVNCFGDIKNIKGQEIDYKVDKYGVLEGFSQVESENEKWRYLEN